MDMTGKNGQPSMEEILASIRRIIAEEPADSISLDFKPRSISAAGTTGPAPGNGAELSLDDTSDFELPSMFRAAITAPDKNNGPIKLMDALRATPQLDAQASATGSRLDTDFPLPAAPVPAPAVATWNDPNPTLHQALSSLRPAMRPELVQAVEGNGHVNGLMMNGSASNGLANGLAPNGLASGYVNGHANGISGLANPAFVMPTVEVVAADPNAPAPWPQEPEPSTDATPVAREMVPFRDQHFARMRGGSLAPVAALDMPAPVVFNVTEAAPAPAVPEPQSFASTAFSSPAFSAATPESFPPPLTSSEFNGVTGLPPALPGIAANAGGAIEDATAELLRPMLRQWLSDNMPRMVEKALHIEVAESVKPARKPGL